MPKDPIQCEYLYMSGYQCHCEADFKVTSAVKPIGLCAIHLGFYLMKNPKRHFQVERLAPRTDKP